MAPILFPNEKDSLKKMQNEILKEKSYIGGNKASIQKKIKHNYFKHIVNYPRVMHRDDINSKLISEEAI